MGDSGLREFRVCPTFAEVLKLPQSPAIIAVDIPIGLPDHAERGGRECDRQAREKLGRRRSSVFNPPVRGALEYVGNDPAARRVNIESSDERISLSAPTCAILAKIREVDELMSPTLQNRVKEVHPELCFYELNRGKAMTNSKKRKAGFEERAKLLEDAGYGELLKSAKAQRPQGVAMNDVVDACAACWTAGRIFKKAIPLPQCPLADAHGLLMQMWR